MINLSDLSIMAGSSSHGCVAYYAKEVHTGHSKIVNENGYLFYLCNKICYLLGYVGAETALTLPDNYNCEPYQIYQYAFSDRTDLTSIEIPSSVISIGACAFASCDSLKSITIPNGVTGIAYGMFANCYNLESAAMPDSVASIGEDAFGICENLVNIYYSSTGERWKKIKKASGWNSSTGTYIVHCTDGDISKNES